MVQGVVHFDGGARPNPGPAGAGWTLDIPGRAQEVGYEFVGQHASNNVAEYFACAHGLQLALDRGVTRVELRGDSKLVLMQVQGKWRCNFPHLMTHVVHCRDLVSRFLSVTFTHVLRKLNAKADALANLAIDEGLKHASAPSVVNVPEDTVTLAPPVDGPVLEPTIPATAPNGLASRVRIRRKNNKTIQWCDRYVGRAVSRGGWELERDAFANPVPLYKVGNDATKAVRAYRCYLYKNPALVQRIIDGELDGKVLGCFCELDSPCHADVLVELANDHSKARAMLDQKMDNPLV